MKQINVFNDGRWVATGGSTTGSGVTQAYVDAAVADVGVTVQAVNDQAAWALNEVARQLSDRLDLKADRDDVVPPTVTKHDLPVPQPTIPTPEGLESNFNDYTDGLHYFEQSGVLVSILRQPYQTTIVTYGATTSVVRVVKSEAGLPTPQNPSTILVSDPTGKWTIMSSEQLDAPFGNPKAVDLFALTGSTTDLSDYYVKGDVDMLVAGRADQLEFSQFQGYVGTLDSEYQEKFRLLNQGFATVAQKPDVDEALSLKSDRASTYTKTEVDAALAGVAAAALTPEQIEQLVSQVGPVDLTAYAKLDDYGQVITASLMKAQAVVFTKANTTLGFARFPEYPDGRLGLEINGAGGELQFVAYVSDLAEYSKKIDNTQNIVARGVVSQAYAFGDAIEPNMPGLAYLDTQEGYGDRLVLDTRNGVEYLVYKSDFDPVKARVESLESKAAPAVDLAPYATVEYCDANYGKKDALDLLRSQTQTIFDSIYTRAESDARYAQKSDLVGIATESSVAATYATKADTKLFVTSADVSSFVSSYAAANLYTQRQVDDRFMRIDQAFSKSDFDNQMALFLYSRKQVDDKLIAINPIGAPTINNPALAEFKKSVLDAVALMLAGGSKQPPADIDWTRCRNAAGTADSASLDVRMIAGVMEFRGTLSTGSISGSQNICQLPASFPLPELTASYPIAARLVGSNAVYTYANFNSANRTVGVTMASTINEVTLSGLRVKAAY